MPRRRAISFCECPRALSCWIDCCRTDDIRGRQRGYLHDGRFEIDNNIVENDVRPSVVGRKRWLFIGHPDAGRRNAVIYTIIQSCRRRGVNPQEYLTDVLSRLPSMKNHEVKDVLPSCWRPRPICERRSKSAAGVTRVTGLGTAWLRRLQ
jgi:hypothetical protein